MRKALKTKPQLDSEPWSSNACKSFSSPHCLACVVLHTASALSSLQKPSVSGSVCHSPGLFTLQEPLTNTSCNFPAGHATEALPDGLLPATSNPCEAAGAPSITVTADGNHSASFKEVGQSRSTPFLVVVNSPMLKAHSCCS